MCMRQKTYDMIFALTIDRAYLVMMMMLMMMNDDVGNMSTCDISGADDAGSEICKQQVTL